MKWKCNSIKSKKYKLSFCTLLIILILLSNVIAQNSLTNRPSYIEINKLADKNSLNELNGNVPPTFSKSFTNGNLFFII